MFPTIISMLIFITLNHFIFIRSDGIDGAIEKYECQRVALLRSISLKVGIQIQLREYALENRNRPIFTEEDIVNVFPIVKHISPRVMTVFEIH